jgi:hypothetical protein
MRAEKPAPAGHKNPHSYLEHTASEPLEGSEKLKVTALRPQKCLQTTISSTVFGAR